VGVTAWRGVDRGDCNDHIGRIVDMVVEQGTVHSAAP
jgi:hypothetical protein